MMLKKPTQEGSFWCVPFQSSSVYKHTVWYTHYIRNVIMIPHFQYVMNIFRGCIVFYCMKKPIYLIFQMRIEVYFPGAGTLAGLLGLYHSPVVSPVFTHMWTWDCPRSLTTCPLPSRLPVCTPPTRLGECFFFNSLIVGPPRSSVFWQLWMFFDFKLVVILLLVVWEDEVYLPTPPFGQKSELKFFRSLI